MTRNYNGDRAWSDQFIPEIQYVLSGFFAPSVLEVASDMDDCRRNTDLIAVPSSKRVSCRMRRWKWWNRNEGFTFHYNRKSGSTTEYSKMKAGYGDYFFYGFEYRDTATLAGYTLLNLSVFREWLGQQEYMREVSDVILNSEEDDMIVFRWSVLPKESIVYQFLPYEKEES